MGRFLSFIKVLILSKLSLLGAALATSCFLADLILVLGELFLFESNPYIGIFTYLFFPGLAVLGLFLMPLGVYLRVKRFGHGVTWAALEELVEVEKVDVLHVLQVVFGLSMLNLVIFGIVGYRGFHFTESKEFCGELCHKVMHPELTTYSRSPHSEIGCVECHIGAGAGWFVKSKLSGLRQVLAVTLDTYSRPIETPIHNLRPAREVCEVCHRPEIFHGNLIKTIEHFEPDERNTRTYTVLNLRVGTGGEHGREAHGIHWHVSRDHELRYYATDRKREKIVWVEVTYGDGTRRVWRRPGFESTDDEVRRQDLRLMDCVDCHNRPTHIYLSPEEALDQWLATGRIDPAIPWIRKLAEEVLRSRYPTRAEADAGIGRLPEIYRERFPDHWIAHRDAVKKTVPVLQEIHHLFVYPEMNIQWNTYNSLIGHPTPYTSACFRCHDGILRDAQGAAITVECESCHYVLSNRKTNPPILRVLTGGGALSLGSGG